MVWKPKPLGICFCGVINIITMNGWIKIHRKLINWEWYADSKMVHLFLHFLLSANHVDGNYRGIPIKRGQLITGLNKITEATGISAQSIRTCINRLKSTNEIQVQSTNKYSIITICNYDDYQLNDFDANKQTTSKLTNEQQTNNKQSTTNNNTNNNKNEENKKNVVSFESCFSFEEFWKVYPNKTAKAESEKKYAKLSEQDRLAIKNSIRSFLDNPPFKGYNFPMPTTFLNQKRWQDVEPQSESKPKQSISVNGMIDLSHIFDNVNK